MPLADASIEHFALDNLAYHGHNLTIIWDQHGDVWPRAGCSGLCLFVDGKLAANSSSLGKIVYYL